MARQPPIRHRSAAKDRIAVGAVANRYLATPDATATPVRVLPVADLAWLPLLAIGDGHCSRRPVGSDEQERSQACRYLPGHALFGFAVLAALAACRPVTGGISMRGSV